MSSTIAEPAAIPAQAGAVEPPKSRMAAVAAWGMVAVFLLLYIVSYIDRTIINMMVGPLERDLNLSDFQISLLAGPAFSIFYILCGLPMGWLVDRFSRRWITAIGVFVWGAATVSCGMAGSYIHIFLGRMGVGLGESTLTPAAHALISESFPPRRLATALSVYSLGAVIGAGIATIVGGAVVHLVVDMKSVAVPLLGEVRPWQAIFLIVGLPTVLLTPLVFLVREKPSSERHARHALSAASSVSFGAMIRKDWVFWLGLPLGFGCTNILANAYAVWSPTLMVREFGWDIRAVGLAWGVQHMVAGFIGQIGGALIVDWLYARGVKDAHVKYQMAGLFISVPTLIWAVNSGNPWAFVVLTGFFFCFTMPFLGYANAAMQLFAPANLRGRVSAMFLAIVTLVGTGLGATVTGFLTDHVFHDKMKVGMSLAIVTLVTAPVIFGVLWVVARKMRAMHAERDALAGGVPATDATI
jgi:MFS family permease